jgi:N6-L-threonylcarbamoyladenine synthase
MLVLGIESSCDETAAAIVRDDGTVLAECVLSQFEEHRLYGGVVPEIAARAHLDHLDRLIAEALRRAGLDIDAIDLVAATGGPGLIGGVIVGVTTGKAIALAAGKPFLAINHLEGHALSARLSPGLEFPYLLLLVSGGHCQLLAVAGVGDYRRLGATIDDAAGEAFDKVAKLIGLGYPGGPAVERAAKGGDSDRFSLPRPMRGRPGCDFSFSGLKNAVRLAWSALEGPTDADRADIAACFQRAVAETMADRVKHGIRLFQQQFPGPTRLVLAGGVAANQALRQKLNAVAAKFGAELVAPPMRLCTDNAAMIAWAGIERWRRRPVADGLDFAPKPRWPLDPAAHKLPFAGVKA